MSNLANARQQVQRLLVELQEQRGGVRIVSLTAKEAQDIRVTMLRQLGEVLEELYKVRDAKQLAKEGQMHVYLALAALMRVREALLSNASPLRFKGFWRRRRMSFHKYSRLRKVARELAEPSDSGQKEVKRWDSIFAGVSEPRPTFSCMSYLIVRFTSIFAVSNDVVSVLQARAVVL